MSIYTSLLIVFLFMSTGATLSSTTPTTPVALKRVALIVGSNTGYERRVQLKYAGRDAQAIADLFIHIGGVEKNNVLLLQDPTIQKLANGFEKIKAMAGKNAGVDRRLEFVLYYSGHADERGLLLGNELLSYTDLRNSIEQMPVDVRIVILDACASGGITREKGGIQRPAFLFDVSSEMKGHAFLTSSSPDEAAQESDRLKGSLFTSNLISGLRGAADVNLDGKVTLDETYQYAFHETLKETEGTFYGPQHPAYDIRLKGTGDLVLTDLRASSAGMRFSESLTGTIFIRDTKGNLLAELNKSRGQPMEIGLNPGTYSVTLDTKQQIREGNIILTKGKFTELNSNEMKMVKKEVNTLRGDTNNDDIVLHAIDSGSDGAINSVLSSTPQHPVREEKTEHDKERIADSIENHTDRAEDSLEKVERKIDRIQDSLQESNVGPEGRTFRVSFVVCGTIQHSRLQLLYGPSLYNRVGLFDIGFQDIAFNQSDEDGDHYYLTLSPAIGLVPFLTRPLRFTAGVGNTFQFEINDNFKTCLSPFLYVSGTCFYVKRISSTVTVKHRYIARNDFNYWSTRNQHINEGRLVNELGVSVDFYF